MLATLVVLASTAVPYGAGGRAAVAATESAAPVANLIDRRDGFVDAGGVMIYYESIGRDRIEALEARGIIDESGAELAEYRKLADEAELPYDYHGRPPPWDSAGRPMGWDVLKQMWGGRSDFHIDGNLVGFDFTPALRRLTVPTLVIYGDHDLLSPATAEETHAAIGNSQLIELRNSAHMTYVDQPAAFFNAVSAFLQ